MARIDEATKKELRKTAEEITKELTPAIKQIYTSVVEEFHLEMSRAYDEIIRQFYTYTTTTYYRHNEGVGTGKGKNLYEAFLSEVEYSGEYANYYFVKIMPDFMESKNYKIDDAGKVLDMVLRGYRSPLDLAKRSVRSRNGTSEANYYSAKGSFLAGGHNNFRAKITFYGRELEGTPLEILKEITKTADAFVMGRCNKIIDSELKDIQKLL